jgi:hypothetical protein
VVGELPVAGVVISPDSGVLESAVHSFDLAVRPRVVGLGKAVFDVVLTANAIGRIMIAAGGGPWRRLAWRAWASWVRPGRSPLPRR